MSPKPIGSVTMQVELMEKGAKHITKSMEALGQGLTLMKHVQAHIPGALGPASKELLARHMKTVEHIIQELADMDLSE